MLGCHERKKAPNGAFFYFVFLVNFGSPNMMAAMPQIPMKTG